MENSKGDLPWFLTNPGSENYLRSVITKLEIDDFCLLMFTLYYITVFQPL